MLNMNKIYSVKSNATRAIKNAVERGVITGDDLEIRKVDGGFQICKIVTEKPETVTDFAEVVVKASETVSKYAAEPIPPKEEAAPETPAPATPQKRASGELSEIQRTLLDALVSSAALSGEWVPMSVVSEADTPNSLPRTSIPGASRGLLAKGYIRTEWGKDDKGKRAAIATVTDAGLAALKAIEEVAA